MSVRPSDIRRSPSRSTPHFNICFSRYLHGASTTDHFSFLNLHADRLFMPHNEVAILRVRDIMYLLVACPLPLSAQSGCLLVFSPRDHANIPHRNSYVILLSGFSADSGGFPRERYHVTSGEEVEVGISL